MKKKILSSIWVMGVLALAVFCLSACDSELDVQQSYPFTLETMPVQKDIIKGQTVEIRCTLKRGGEFADTRYTIRYFQPDGKGTLKMDEDRKSTRLNSSHANISYAVFCLKKKNI